MQKRNIAILLSTIIFSIIALMASFSLAWFTPINISNIDGAGYSNSAYFAYGDGSQENPYGINDKRHLNNLAWLQHIGYFGNEHIYFEIADNIDASGLVIPPIGTQSQPFIGFLDGNNKTISNLKITNDEDEFSNKPSNIEFNQNMVKIVGFFGVIGEINETSYSSQVNSVSNLILENIVVKSKTSETLIGLIAGFANADINNVNVTGKSKLDISGQTTSNIVGLSDSVSKYSLVGYTTKEANKSNKYVQKLSKYYYVGPSDSGDDSDDTGSFASIDYTTWIYDLFKDDFPSSIGSTVYSKSVSGEGGYTLKFTTSATSTNNNPKTSQVINRLRDGSFLPLKFEDKTTKNKTKLTNTGYLVGSDIGNVNASPKISAYKMVNIGNALSEKSYTSYSSTYKNEANISYDNSKLQVLTYSLSQNDWVRIKDDYNSAHTTNNGEIKDKAQYTYSDLELTQYKDAREYLGTEILNGASMIHGIHFDNNVVSTSNLLEIPANTARIGGTNISSTYQVPKGSIDFNFKKDGYISFFAGTYNSSDVDLNFFSLNQVIRKNDNTIDDIKPIYNIYENLDTSEDAPAYVYKYSDGTYSSGMVGDELFDVEASLISKAPVTNMLYYFELPVNKGEYAMGIAENKSLKSGYQGAYLIYLDLKLNEEESQSDTITAYTITTIRSGNAFPVGVDFLPISVSGDGGDTIAVSISSNVKGSLIFDVTNSDISVSGDIGEYAYRSTNYIISNPNSDQFTCNLSGDPPEPPGGETNSLFINIQKSDGSDDISIKITDYQGENGDSKTIYEVYKSSTLAYEEVGVDDVYALSTTINSATKLENLKNLDTAVVLSRTTGDSEFVANYIIKECDDSTVVVSIEANGAYMSINVETGYTFKISENGELNQYIDGSNYPNNS